jgi:hypothetical protein
MKRLLVLAPFLLAVLPAQVLEDSPRLGSLIRGGNLYLSLQDAIAIALENNLDVELQRFGPRFAAIGSRRPQEYQRRGSRYTCPIAWPGIRDQPLNRRTDSAD